MADATIFTLFESSALGTISSTADVPIGEVDDTTVNKNVDINEFPTIVENVIEGTLDSETLLGEQVSDAISGAGGNDIILGFGSFDFLEGGDGNDIVIGGSGDDRIKGDSGNDFLRGDRGQDNLEGGEGTDLLLGGRNRDFFRGDEGQDVFIGGQGSDVFVLQPGQGTDTVIDFKDGTDLLGIFPDLGFDELEISQMGANTAITVEQEQVALLVGVDAELITASDFAQVTIAL